MSARPRPSLALAAIGFLMVAGVANAEEATAVGDLVIESPWARASIGTSRPGAAYFRVRNTGTTDDVRTAVETPVAHMAELHATEMKDGVVSMVPVETLNIPAGGEAALKPGGTHVMLMMLTAPLKEGESVPLTLVFEHAGRIDLTVPVYGVGSRGPIE